jgi:hypothetical protein
MLEPKASSLGKLAGLQQTDFLRPQVMTCFLCCLIFECITSRVTRLGEFSPIGRLFTLGSFCDIAEVTTFFGLLFCIDFDKSKGWATAWATFSPTHPVTLIPSDVRGCVIRMQVKWF